MNANDVRELLASAIPRSPGAWLELGAGTGAFTRALVELLGPTGVVYAVDRDPRALATLERWAAGTAPNVLPIVADFNRARVLPGLDGRPLDGMLCANALHFVADADRVLARFVAGLRPGGRVVLVEYDRRRASPWVPHPIPLARLPALAAAAGLSTPVVTAKRPSAYGGDLYVAAAIRGAGA